MECRIPRRKYAFVDAVNYPCSIDNGEQHAAEMSTTPRMESANRVYCQRNTQRHRYFLSHESTKLFFHANVSKYWVVASKTMEFLINLSVKPNLSKLFLIIKPYIRIKFIIHELFSFLQMFLSRLIYYLCSWIKIYNYTHISIIFYFNIL